MPEMIDNYAQNIRAIFRIATPSDYRIGLDWYPLAQRIAASISGESRIMTDAIAATISALSPRNKWAVNVKNARDFAMAAHNNTPEPSACTFKPNRAKAWRIVNGESWRDVLSGIKVESFVANILGDLNRVTVDVWAMRCATLGVEDAVKNDATYRIVEQAYQLVAAEVGLAPAELQAITWTTISRMLKGIKSGDARRSILIDSVKG